MKVNPIHRLTRNLKVAATVGLCALGLSARATYTFLPTNDLSSTLVVGFFGTNSAGYINSFGALTNLPAAATGNISTNTGAAGVALVNFSLQVARIDPFWTMANTNGAYCSYLATNGTLAYFPSSFSTNAPGSGGTNPATFIWLPPGVYGGTNTPLGNVNAGYASIYIQFDATGTNPIAQFFNTATSGSGGWVANLLPALYAGTANQVNSPDFPNSTPVLFQSGSNLVIGDVYFTSSTATNMLSTNTLSPNTTSFIFSLQGLPSSTSTANVYTNVGTSPSQFILFNGISGHWYIATNTVNTNQGTVGSAFVAESVGATLLPTASIWTNYAGTKITGVNPTGNYYTNWIYQLGGGVNANANTNQVAIANATGVTLTDGSYLSAALGLRLMSGQGVAMLGPGGEIVFAPAYMAILGNTPTAGANLPGGSAMWSVGQDTTYGVILNPLGNLYALTIFNAYTNADRPNGDMAFSVNQNQSVTGRALQLVMINSFDTNADAALFETEFDGPQLIIGDAQKVSDGVYITTNQWGIRSFRSTFAIGPVNDFNQTNINPYLSINFASGAITGNGSGLTNMSVVNFTNITAGALLTNNSSYTWNWRIPAQVSSPITTAGSAESDIQECVVGGTLTTVAALRIGFGSAGIVDTNDALLVADVPPGWKMSFTNFTSGTGYVAGTNPTAPATITIHP